MEAGPGWRRRGLGGGGGAERGSGWEEPSGRGGGGWAAGPRVGQLLERLVRGSSGGGEP